MAPARLGGVPARILMALTVPFGFVVEFSLAGVGVYRAYPCDRGRSRSAH